jgi:hypothetical protein
VCLGCATMHPAVDPNTEGGNTVEKYGLSVAELEAQHVELLPDRIEMRHRRRRRHSLVQDCDSVMIQQGIVNIPIANATFTNCVVT